MLRSKVGAFLKLLGLFYLLFRGGLTVAVCCPFADAVRRSQYRQRWAADILAWLDIRLVLPQVLPLPGTLIASNHVSWMDVIAINAWHPGVFVAKTEVRGWPLIGWLADKNDTLFIVRGHRKSALNITCLIGAALTAGKVVTIFPEGTTTEGEHVERFHAALFEAACQGKRTVLPLAVMYLETGENKQQQRSKTAVYIGETSLLASMWAVSAMRGMAIHLQTATPISCVDLTRRQIADMSHEQVSAMVKTLNNDTPENCPEAAA